MQFFESCTTVENSFDAQFFSTSNWQCDDKHFTECFQLLSIIQHIFNRHLWAFSYNSTSYASFTSKRLTICLSNYYYTWAIGIKNVFFQEISMYFCYNKRIYNKSYVILCSRASFFLYLAFIVVCFIPIFFSEHKHTS